MTSFIDQCRQIVGDAYVVTDQVSMAPFLTEYRKRYTGNAQAIIRPASTEQVAAIVKVCLQHQVGIVPQGGNTGLVVGSVPDQLGNAIVLSLQRMNRVRQVDSNNNTICVEAGCVLEHIQNVANDHGRLFPLSLASQGSCTIGGNLSTNAGGTGVLYYGNCRALCLGLEVVTAQGEIWSGLRGLRKDNSGYDLKDLYIGAEGTLGIITAAMMALFPKPRSQVVAMASIKTVEDAIELLNFLNHQNSDKILTAFELISDYCLHLVRKHFPNIHQPTLGTQPYYVLIEFSSQEDEARTTEALHHALESALNHQLAVEVVVASSSTQSEHLWKIREHVSEAQSAEGKNIKHDLAVPVSQLGKFVAATDQLLLEKFPGCRLTTFGHAGDGNLHYNVSAPLHSSIDEFLAKQNDINRVVYDNVAKFSGTISAEHGIGSLKIEEMLRHKSDVEIALMRNLKSALDPSNIMNPGKVVPPVR